MNAVLHAEYDEVSQLRRRLTETMDRGEMAKAVLVYLGNMKVIGTPGCPEDFRTAFRDYLDAWQRFADRLSDPADDPKCDEIDRRWEDVLAAARKVGAE